MIYKKMYIWRVIFLTKTKKHLLYMKNKRYKIEKVAYSWVLGHMQKKTTDTMTMTSDDRHIVTQTDFPI